MAKLTLNVDPDRRYAHARAQSLSAVPENYIKSVTLKEERAQEEKIQAAIKKLSGAINCQRIMTTKRICSNIHSKQLS